MAAGLNNVLKHLRKVAAAENAEKLSDRQLVERFVAESDETAFLAALLPTNQDAHNSQASGQAT